MQKALRSSKPEHSITLDGIRICEETKIHDCTSIRYEIDLPFIRLHSYVWGIGREFGDGNPEPRTVAFFGLQFGQFGQLRWLFVA